MSLLLLFPSGTGAISSSCWLDATIPSTNWDLVNLDSFAPWGGWEGSTWGSLETRTWAQMARDVFVDVAAPSTTWTALTLPAEDCGGGSSVSTGTGTSTGTGGGVVTTGTAQFVEGGGIEFVEGGDFEFIE